MLGTSHALADVCNFWGQMLPRSWWSNFSLFSPYVLANLCSCQWQLLQRSCQPLFFSLHLIFRLLTLPVLLQLSVAAAATQLLTQLAVSSYQEAIVLPDVDILSEAMQVNKENYRRHWVAVFRMATVPMFFFVIKVKKFTVLSFCQPWIP